MEMKAADSLDLKASRLFNAATFVDTNLGMIQPCQIGFPTVTLMIGMFFFFSETLLDHSVWSG